MSDQDEKDEMDELEDAFLVDQKKERSELVRRYPGVLSHHGRKAIGSLVFVASLLVAYSLMGDRLEAHQAAYVQQVQAEAEATRIGEFRARCADLRMNYGIALAQKSPTADSLKQIWIDAGCQSLRVQNP